MCDPVTALVAVASAASTGLGILQQTQQADQQRGTSTSSRPSSSASCRRGWRRRPPTWRARRSTCWATSRRRAGDALSLCDDGLRNPWENRVRGVSRQAQARTHQTAAGRVDATLGIVKTLLS